MAVTMREADARDQRNDAPGQADRTFTITELAEAFDVTPRAIRFYEDKGLLNPVRQGLARIYTRRDRARLALILRGKRLGFSLTEIGEMLDLYDLGDDQSEQLRVTLTKSRERLAVLEAQRRDLDDAIRELKESCLILDGFLEHRQQDASIKLSDYLRARGLDPGSGGC